MNLFDNKKSEALTIILVVIIISVFLGWFINFSSRECRSNNDCQEDYYCGSDHACHQIPVIEKTIVKNNLLVPSIIIGIAIIIAALILKSFKIPFRRKRNVTMKTEEKTEEQPKRLKIP